MKQEQFNYKYIIELGFEEELAADPTYFDQYGYEYVIITKWLTKKIYLDWTKDERVVNLYRIDNQKNCNILASMPIKNKAHLTQIIEFFKRKN